MDIDDIPARLYFDKETYRNYTRKEKNDIIDAQSNVLNYFRRFALTFIYFSHFVVGFMCTIRAWRNRLYLIFDKTKRIFFEYETVARKVENAMTQFQYLIYSRKPCLTSEIWMLVNIRICIPENV